ncbi:cytochrome c oxidase assembly protein [Micromonospora sp. 15K316]|uniref:cytochrome c oxidase assembly protein n=1 Tax=Micromonospora sp. 15K316 TaxID=2530376 RepID=UPI00104A476B|nr:cytochrome c oxidase assembly protein [Micromonospora sp. 15K316]TDC28893.1 cytochrome c oxidase assembly protein [Micromonospora sp. 15K316]
MSLLALPDRAADADPLALAVVALLAGGYLFALSRDRRCWPRRRTGAWLAGCALLAVALGPPALLPAGPAGHMAQHLLIGMFAPLALVLGAPVTLLLRVAPPPVRRAVAGLLRARPLHVLAHPATAVLLSTGGLWLVLATPLYAAAESHRLLHHGLHLHYLLAGYLVAWSVAGPDPAPRRPGLPVRLGALLIASAGHSVLAKYLYAHADTLPPGLAERDADGLRAAARLMYYGGDLAELLLAIALFGAWYGRRWSRAKRGPHAPTGGQVGRYSTSGRPGVP